ncbi:MAG TPA: thermonuclease family protein [Candidatus Saccharimonadia bacterium]
MPALRRNHRRALSLTTLVAALVLAYVQLATPTAKPTPDRPPTTTSAAGPAAKPTGAVEAATDAVLSAQPGLAHVDKDVDGDTIDVTLGGKKATVRFIGIDTPETHDPRKPIQCFGEAAAAHTKALLDGKAVRLEADPTNSDRDKYGRLLRYVYLPDGTLVNAALIHDGYAFAYTIFPFNRLDEFRALEADARANSRGLWGGCNVDDSKDIKQTTGAK